MTPGPGIFRTSFPKGFFGAGVNCGVRKYRPDVGMIMSEFPCVAAGVFTLSSAQAAPVQYCRSILPSDQIRAVITNSGQANAATGEQGVTDNLLMVEAAAAAVGCDPKQVLSASTGVIGEPMAINKITAATPELMSNMTDIAEKFALAVMTTDLVPKTVMKTVELSQGAVQITGVSKGSGMIHPNMATMLGYLLTDLALPMDEAYPMLKEVTDNSFNMISVDGETSTNDSVFLLANGASGVGLANQEDKQVFLTALQEVAIVLAKSIARDGEGASKLIEVNVVGAPTALMAKRVARALTTSPLIKTAAYGESPNWGRVYAKLGEAMVPPDILALTNISFQDVVVLCKGVPVAGAGQDVGIKMKADTLTLAVDLGSGDSVATAWGCDLSERYVKINAEYLT